MKKPKIFALTLVLALCFGALAACQDTQSTPSDTTDALAQETETEQPTQEGTEVQTYDPTALFEQTYSLLTDTEHFKHHGRLFTLADGLACDHVMSGIEFEGVMYGEVKITVDCDRDTYFTVFVDGEKADQRFHAPAGACELIVADFDTAEMHNVRLLKQTEPQFSLCTLKDVTLTGELSDAPAQKPLYIEFLGDSITSGYGILGQSNSENPGGVIWHDGTQTYAAQTALALDADCSMISCSGIGISKGFPFFDMQQYYEKASFFRDWTSENSNHVFERVPDIVVINLGTNDYSQGATEQGMKDSIKKLITFIRTVYGKDVPIVWVHNMMGDCRFEWTQVALEELGGEQAGIYTVRASANHSGTHGHPNPTGHKAAARRLTEKINEILQAE